MKKDCAKCKYINGGLIPQDHIDLCNKQRGLFTCKNFTLQEEYLREAQISAFKKDKHYELFKYLFRTFKLWMNPTHKYNTKRYENFYMVYSLDQDKFLKRPISIPIFDKHYLPISFNLQVYKQLEKIIGNDGENIEYNGHFINGSYVKDDIWVEYNNFVNTVFHNIILAYGHTFDPPKSKALWT